LERLQRFLELPLDLGAGNRDFDVLLAGAGVVDPDVKIEFPLFGRLRSALGDRSVRIAFFAHTHESRFLGSVDPGRLDSPTRVRRDRAEAANPEASRKAGDGI